MKSIYARICRNYNSYSKIGFIGLGQMGKPMVNNLIKKYKDIVLFDSSSSATEIFAGKAKIAQDMSEMISREIVFLMLPDANITKNVLFSSKFGLNKVLKPGSTIVNSGTIGIHETEQIAREIGPEINFIDAPVSGGTVGAKNASLTFMVSGKPEVIERITPILKEMGVTIVMCGDAGKGQAMKICNNMLLAITMEGVSETFALAEKMQIDLKVLNSVINSSSGRSWSSEVNNPVPGIVTTSPASNDYCLGFSSKLLLKDIRLAVDESKRHDMSLPALNASGKSYEEMITLDTESQSKDMSYMFQYLSKK